MIQVDLSRWSEPQRQAIQARGENVLVSAGAGSGKTSVLVERVVHCVIGEHPVDVDRLLVVTFTEAAAGEMRKRISDRLQVLADAANQIGDSKSARHLQRQIALLEQAQISTLHSFCMQVVRRNFLHLGIEPVFDLLDEDDALLVRANLLDNLVEERLEASGDGLFAEMLGRFAAGDPRKLAPLVYRLDIFSRSQANPVEWLDTMQQRFASVRNQSFDELPWTRTFLQWGRRHLDEALALFRKGRHASNGYEELMGYADNLEQLIGLVEQATVMLSDVHQMDQAADTLNAAITVKSPRAKDHPVKEKVQSFRTAGLRILKIVHDVLARGEAALHQDIVDLAPAVGELVTLVRDFQSVYQQHKKTSGVLDFSDLEHLALQSLLDPVSGESRRLQEQYEEIFVDEYQDTSPIQDALVNAIARPEGNVFVVGDVKQSIYRFRMAEPQLFMDKYQSLGAQIPGKVIDLSANYRSRVEVVDAVNFFFQQLFSQSFGGIVYDERTQMRAGAQYGEADGLESLTGPVEVHLVERNSSEPGDGSEDDTAAATASTLQESSNVDGDTHADDDDSEDDLSAMEKEALVIGQRIRELTGHVDGYTPRVVWDVKAGLYRRIRYRDIVVLLRSVKSRMNAVLDVFRKLDIPAYGATSTGFYGALEVQWLLSGLAAVDNPRREIDLVACMRSPLGNFTDDELAKIRCAVQGNFYDAVQGVAKSRGVPAAWMELAAAGDEDWGNTLIAKTNNFFHQFQSWRSLSRRAQTEDVLRRMLADTGFLHYVSGMRGGRVREANVHVLLDKARAFDRSSFDGVYGFVTRAREALAHDVDVGEARTLTESEDVVRVMTIHQSKGLEYPVVFVADLGKAFHRDPLERAFPLHRDLGFGPQFTDPHTDQRWKTVPSIAIEESDLQEFLAEEARVLYVAMTRAREKLILVGSARKLMDVVVRAADAFQLQEPTLPFTTMMGAKSYLDWILPALVRHADGEALRTWADVQPSSTAADVLRDHAARFQVVVWNLPAGRDLPKLPALPAKRDVEGAMLHGDPERLGEVIQEMARSSANDGSPVDSPEQLMILDPAASVSTPGKISATELRRLWVAKHDSANNRSHAFRNPAAAEHLLEDPSFIRGQSATGRETGIAFHAVMQHIDFGMIPTPTTVRKAIQGMVESGAIGSQDAASVSVEEVVAFLQSDLGRRLAAARQVMREQPFFYRIQLGDEVTADGETEAPFVVAQGVIDCLAEEESGWLIVDYKTDKIGSQDAEAKAQEYAAQIATYLAVAASTIPDRPVQAYIYFVKPGIVVPMHRVNVKDVF